MIVTNCFSEYEDVTIEMTLADTSGDEAYDRLRPLSYIDADLVVICAAMDRSPASVSERWLPEARHILPKASESSLALNMYVCLFVCLGAENTGGDEARPEAERGPS